MHFVQCVQKGTTSSSVNCAIIELTIAPLSHPNITLEINRSLLFLDSRLWNRCNQRRRLSTYNSGNEKIPSTLVTWVTRNVCQMFPFPGLFEEMEGSNKETRTSYEVVDSVVCHCGIFFGAYKVG